LKKARLLHLVRNDNFLNRDLGVDKRVFLFRKM
jgi:hypothetical protein